MNLQDQKKKLNLLRNKIGNSFKKFTINLKGKTVLTEAATGNYVVTPILAALAGATVYAKTRNSTYGSVEEVKELTNELAILMGVKKQLNYFTEIEDIPLSKVDIVTNTGFVRPIGREMVYALPQRAIILLMYEAWEFRSEDIDLKACKERGIPVYATNESDPRVCTLDYLGFTVLKLLLDNQCSPYSSSVLLLGCEEFIKPVVSVLKANGYKYKVINNYRAAIKQLDSYDAIVFLEHQQETLLFGEGGVVAPHQVKQTAVLIHICGNVDWSSQPFLQKFPTIPAKFGYMSYTVDYVDAQAVIDLHMAALEIASNVLLKNVANLIQC